MIKINELISVYKKLFMIRHVEEQIAEKYAEQEMRCPVHLSIGQEATAVGVCINLGKEDQVLSAHRSILIIWLKAVICLRC